ncbi:uncharacterized protein LOC121431450 [Lytechinus variegatus]|uniref:uncharacterized protein LOC121431450 n=1 Tax=Lytechinus variegatus TaxID=7654 RepID=UPI001BB2343D|nr:uncharacterized protein LOC121431450 [Lytechinus variegatus]
MVSQKIASVITAFTFILQHYYTLGTGFSCDFGTLDSNTHRGLSDCDVIHPNGKKWHVISGAEYSSLYWLDTTWKRNGGFYLTWTRDPNGRSIFRLPNYQMTKPFATLSFYYKFFGEGQSRMRVRLCDDVIFDVTDKEERWFESPDLEICCYEEGWNRPDISFEVEWTPQSGRVGIDSITVTSMTRTDINYDNDGASCKVHTTSSPSTTPLLTTANTTTYPKDASGRISTTMNSSALSSHSSLYTHEKTTTSYIRVSDHSILATDSRIFEGKDDISFFDFLENFPINLAFYVPIGSLVLVITLCGIYICGCRRRRKSDQQKSNLDTLANCQEQGQDSSAPYQTFHAMKKPSETPKKKSNVDPRSSSDDSQCYIERSLKRRLGLSEEYRNNRPRVLAGGTGKNAALYNTKPNLPLTKSSTGPTGMIRAPIQTPTVMFACLKPKEYRNHGNYFAKESFHQPPEVPSIPQQGNLLESTKRESRPGECSTQQYDQRQIQDYYDMSEVVRPIMPTMIPREMAGFVGLPSGEGDLSSPDNDEYQNITMMTKSKDKLITDMESEDSRIYENAGKVHEECGIYIEF